ncbi:MAG TPA: hypothetical protein VFV49_11885 [Thermoanaerobaculia bacterium]|nr:hypothetical protein [Thermoanaerobaculia bacterium]
MKFKLPALLALCMLLFAGTASALQTDELIAISAMPLAVADVVALPDVPRDDVITVVTTLNQAAVPAPQFVEIVRYVPVALVQPAEPRFVTYVTQEYQRGIVGEPLALAIADRYDTYGIEEFRIVDPPVLTVVERREILPPVVVTRFQPVQFDPLSLIAMPLAVAAVADLVDVPRTDLMQFVASLNQAMVPAPQFVEVVRYSPVVLVDRTASPQFIRFVTTEVDRGVIGRPLAFAIAERIETFEPIDIDIIQPQPRLIVDRDVILPPVVVSRVARAHPHGGPPGQLKKERGLQTGAEVVHGTLPSRSTRSRTVVARNDDRDRRQTVTKERRAQPRKVVRSDDNRSRSKAKVTRTERSDRGSSRVRQERPRPAPSVRRQSEQRRPEKVRVSAGSRGNSAAPAAKQRGNSGGGGGKGKAKGKDKGKG